ncbi:MAG: cupin domain-containing protein [Microscillaceae bacterium]|jgi:hypothetical protein|nr:cupin domain-containing protein [Microscillaceae bacterium]
MNAQYWIEKLKLHQHPEGGYFRETYRASEELALDSSKQKRSYATAIYFLLTGENFSAFHRIQSDEMWHFYTGSAVEIYYIDSQKQLQVCRLGQNFAEGECFQALVPAGCWFASRVLDPQAYALVGCTVAPGFDFADFELANRAQLIELYPEHAAIITQFTRN